MKQILILCLILLSWQYTVGQTLYGVLPTQNERVTYVVVESVPGLTKQQIYRRARRWFVENFRSANHVLQLQDEQTGELVGKGLSGVSRESTSLINHTLNFRRAIYIDCKDGRYRITLREFTISPGGNDLPIESDRYTQYFSRGKMEDYARAMHQDNQLVIKSLKEAITFSHNEDW